MVKFQDCQISIQDQLHQGSILLALSSGTLQHALSSDTSHERIDLNATGLQLFTVPLDVDVKSHATWLKTLADGSYCPSSYGLLEQVIAPIPTQIKIWIDRENKFSVKNRVKLDLPAIDVQVNLMSKCILEQLTTCASELIHTKLDDKNKDRLALLRKHHYQDHSLYELVQLKQQLKWQIAALKWRQICCDDFHMNERAMAVENGRILAFELETASRSSTNGCTIGRTTTTRYQDEQFLDELHRLTQQYQSLSEVTRFMAIDVQKQQSVTRLPNVDLDFTLHRASLILSGENDDIVEVKASSLCFRMELFEDHSGTFALTLQTLSVNNLCPGTPYPDLLLPIYSRSWEGDDMFLRVDAEIAKSVRNMTVVQHFEVNVHPIQVCITQEVIMQLIAFFSPPERTKTATEERREEVRSHFLQARTGSDRSVGSAFIKAVKSAGKAAAHPLSIGRAQRPQSDDELSSVRKTEGKAFHHTPDEPSRGSAELASLSELNEPFMVSVADDAELHHSASNERERSEAKDENKPNVLFKRIRLGAVEVVLTYRNKKSHSHSSHLSLSHASQPQALEDMRGFEVKTRALVYCDKECSPVSLLVRIRRDILLDVLSQVGRNFTNIGNFLRDQFDMSRWTGFDGLAPLKSLSTTLTAIAPSHTSAVTPFDVPPFSASLSDAQAETYHDHPTTLASLRPTKSLSERQAYTTSDNLTDHYDADTSAPSTPTSAGSAPLKQVKRRSFRKLFARRGSSLTPLPSTQ